jgi:hypothetical protein
MSSSQSSSGSSGSFSVGLSTARFLDQAILDEVAPTAVPVPRPAPTLAPSPPAAAPVKAAERSESDEEISSYMSQLLKRSGQVSLGASAAPSNSPSAPVKPQAQGVAENSEQPPATEELPWTEAQYIPKKLAPEREADLRAFRQLANASARGALNSFQQKKQRKLCKSSGFLAIGSLAAAVPLYLWGSQFGDQWGLSALTALVVGGVFGFRFYKSRGGLEK